MFLKRRPHRSFLVTIVRHNLRVLLIAAASLGVQPAHALIYVNHCDLQRIEQLLQSSRQVPSLIGCGPNDVRSLLRRRDYGLAIDQRIPSDVPIGLIAGQRVQSSMVHVDLSLGPSQQPTHTSEGSPAGDPPTAAAPPAPAEQPHHQPHVLRDLAEAFVRGVTQQNPPAQQPQQPPAQVDVPTPDIPAPPLHVSQPPLYEYPAPTETSEAAPQPQYPTDVTPQAALAPAVTNTPPSKPATTKPQSPRTTPNHAAAPVAVDLPKAQAAAALPVQTMPQGPDISVTPPPPPKFFIEGNPTATQGAVIEFVIHRQGDDQRAHVVQLAYNDPTLLVSPQNAITFGAGPPDTMTLRLQTARAFSGRGDHHLAVTLTSADAAEIVQPNTVEALIVERETLFEQILSAISHSRALQVLLAVAGAAAIAGLGSVLVPRATCTLGPGRPSLGPIPLRSHWPALIAKTILGSASFSIPEPLPMERRPDAQPSPA